MANKVCRINGTYEFPFDFMSERASYNEVTHSYEPILRFQANLANYNSFVVDLIPFMGNSVTSIEVVNIETQETINLSEAYDTIIDVSTNFPQSGEMSGQIVFTNYQYAAKEAIVSPSEATVTPDDSEPRIE